MCDLSLEVYHGKYAYVGGKECVLLDIALCMYFHFCLAQCALRYNWWSNGMCCFDVLDILNSYKWDKH